MKQAVELLCVGNAIVDVFANAPPGFLEHWGLSPGARHLDHARLNAMLEALGMAGSALWSGADGKGAVVSGGGGANVAKIAALLGISSLFAGAVGRDAAGQFFEQELREAGAGALLVQGKAPTGLCLILQRPGAGPCIAASTGAALEFDEAAIPEDRIQEARVLLIDGYMLDREALTRRIMEMAVQHGTVIALDVGSAAMAAARAAEIRRFCDDYPLILFMNEAEAEAFYEAQGAAAMDEEPETPVWGGWTHTARFQTFYQKFTGKDIYPIIAVKQGHRGATVFAGGTMYRAGTLALYAGAESTGAGDAFCAAFLAAWIRGTSLADCAALGNRAAREILNVPGTMIGRKKLAPIAKILAAHDGR
ncbi:MAG: PfkB family carbohydrate kinase [Treponema sp.]|jgi:sugar/nucleoside kinase (ribokinase family)|nr:PfkB family carbohydrate kinase [Treponema sp.]